MCNAVSEIYSLHTDSKELLHGNLTKLPEVLLETNNVLLLAGDSKYLFGKKIKKGYDSFVKNGFEKSKKLAEINLDSVSLVSGLTNSYIVNKDEKPKTKVLSMISFLSGFVAKVMIEDIMNTKNGIDILQKTSSMISKVVTKPLSFLTKNTDKIKDLGTYIISGLLFQIISDKVSEKVEGITDKYFLCGMGVEV